jgi:hypothetical protein
VIPSIEEMKAKIAKYHAELDAIGYVDPERTLSLEDSLPLVEQTKPLLQYAVSIARLGREGKFVPIDVGKLAKYARIGDQLNVSQGDECRHVGKTTKLVVQKLTNIQRLIDSDDTDNYNMEQALLSLVLSAKLLNGCLDGVEWDIYYSKGSERDEQTEGTAISE